MKKLFALMVSAGLTASAAFGAYTVDARRLSFYFEDENQSNPDAPRLCGNDHWFDLIGPATCTLPVPGNGATSFDMRATMQDPSKTVKAWGLTTGAIADCTWSETASTNYTCRYDSRYDNKTVYLHLWLRWLRYGIVFESNEGSHVSSLSDLCYTNSVSLPVSSRTGYTLEGWTNGTSSATFSGSTTGEALGVAEDGETVTLYAKWAPAKYTVTFDKNGEGASVSPTTKAVTYGATYGDLPTPQWTGYAFDGWFTERSGGLQVSNRTAVVITAAQTLYARWTALHTVTFTDDKGNTYDQYVDVRHGDTVTPPDITAQIPEGYRLQGWEYGGTVYAPGQKFTVFQPMALVAKFTAIQTTITYSCEPSGVGTVSLGDGNNASGDYGRVVTLTARATAAAYEFNRWSDGVTDATRTFNVVADTNLVARFTKKHFDVEFFDLDGLTQVGNVQTVEYGESANAPEPPAHEGLHFTGWNADFSSVTNGLSVVAQYATNVYTIVYDGNGAEYGSMTNETRAYWTTFNLPSNAYTRSVHAFLGWSTDPHAATNEVPYADGAMVSNLMEADGGIVTLYAVWGSLLTPYSLAADCTNLILNCESAAKWEIDYSSGYASTSSVYVAGAGTVPMTVAIGGKGTLLFKMKASSESNVEISTLCGFMIDGTDHAEVEDHGAALGEWVSYGFSKKTEDRTTYQWHYDGVAGEAVAVDQVHWYPGHFVIVSNAICSISVTNEIREAILDHWNDILTTNAAIVTTIIAQGNSVTNAAELLRLGLDLSTDVTPDGEGAAVKVTGDTATVRFVDFTPPEDIARAKVTVDCSPVTYNGSAWEPAVQSVLFDGTPLEEGTHYTLAYSDNVNAGTATITLKGIFGRDYGYGGTFTTNFVIRKATYDMSGVKWDYAGPFPSDGSTVWTVQLTGLPAGVTATYSGHSAVDAGSYTAHAELTYDTVNYEAPAAIPDLAWRIEDPALSALEAALAGLPVTIAADGAGGWTVTLTNDVAATAAIEIPDNLGKLTVDLNGHALSGPEGQPALRVVAGSGAGEATQLTFVTSDGAAAVMGGVGAPAVAVAEEAQTGVVVNVGASVTVQGGGAEVPAVDGTIGTNDGTVAKVTVAVPTVAAKVYNGKTQTADVAASDLYSVTANGGGVNVGAYAVELTLADANLYEWADGKTNPLKLTFEITKATYDMTGVKWDYTGAFTYDGTVKTVRLTGLPAGVTASYTGNMSTAVGTNTAHATLAYDTKNYKAPGAVDDLVWVIKANGSSGGGGSGEGGDDGEIVWPTIAGTIDLEFAQKKAQTVLRALFDANSNLVGAVQLKVGKIGKKGVKLSSSATLMNGKKVKAKTVTVPLREDGTLESRSLVFKAPIGTMDFAMVAANGDFTLENGAYRTLDFAVGGDLENGTAVFSAVLDPLPAADTGYAIIEAALPTNVTVAVSKGKKLNAGKAAAVKYKKFKDKASGAVWYELVGLDDAAKPNVSGLKLTYAPKTGLVKGSFKVYATNAAVATAGKAPKIKKYKVSLIGFIVHEGGSPAGIGDATMKKPAVKTWSFGIEWR